MRRLDGFLMVAMCAAASVAQAPPPHPPTSLPSPVPQIAVANEYQVGPGDVLEIVVFGNEDLSRITNVQPNGTVSLALLGEVQVAGLTVAETKAKLTSLLARDYLVNPQVDVNVKEYQSQYVTLIGEVNSPGKKPLRGRTRLVDALVEAGGFTPRASGEIVITRVEGTLPGDQRTLKTRLGSGTLTPQDQVNLEILLQSGDIITASPKYYVTLEGEVMRPNRYVLDGDLTVTGVISSAGGLTRFGSQDVKVRRVDAATGQTRIFEVDLKAVRKGKVADPLLLPNDVVSVSRRLF